MNKGKKLIVLVGPSGSGKTTIAKKLIKDFEKLRFSVSATTRPPRKSESDGEEYYFLSEAEFDQYVEKNEFLEWEKVYNGVRYGTLRSEVDRQLKSGYFAVLDIDVKGALNVKKIYGEDCLAIFIKPPSLKELKKRLIHRKSESTQTLEVRLKRAEQELKYENKFDHTVVNSQLHSAYQNVKNLVSEFLNK